MKTDLRLFIGNKEVEFSSDPKILYNYKETELHNPTIVRNGWSKTITIDSTPQNDDIFNHFWNLQRTQFGADFNAMVKAPFSLYNNGEIIEAGYVKLNSVKTSNHRTTYEIQLFSKIGDFFYSLSYNQLDDSDSKKTLADLLFTAEWTSEEPDLGFDITKETIAEAWDTLLYNDNKDKWQVINFCPTALNGIPNDFDADKVLVNCRGTESTFQKGLREEGVDYLPVINGSFTTSGYCLGTAAEPMTCDETFDLRSYLQRPVINVQRILLACFQPENNGGYQVKLDNHFFDTKNPYWGYQVNTPWMTLPMLRDLGIEGQQTENISGATFTKQTTNKWVANYGTTLSELNNVRMRVNITFEPDDPTTATTLYPYRKVDVSGGFTLKSNTYVIDYVSNAAAIIQLFARDINGKICGSSKAYILGQNEYIAGKTESISKEFWNETSPYPKPSSYEFIQGKWVKSGGVFFFCDNDGVQKDIEFTFDSSSKISSIEMRAVMNRSEYTKYKSLGNSSQYAFNPSSSFMKMWDNTTASARGNVTKQQAASGGVMGDIGIVVTDFEAIATTYEGMFSGRHITKEQLLATDYSPCDVLLSYAKMFGLYFYYDPSESADDPELCPKGVIHILDRDTFYTDEVVDIDKDIDRSRDMTISPTLATSKWYAFDLEQVESDCEQAYEETYGTNYGRQLVNTNYNFDNNTNNLYESSVFKGGIMCREKDKYFVYPLFHTPAYVYNGFTYELYANGGDGYDSVELNAKMKSAISAPINNLGLPFYDILPKLQLHSRDNAPSDGAGVLLFYRQGVETRTPSGMLDYWLTDDLHEMAVLNGGQPCWIWTNIAEDGAHNTIGIKVNTLPFFTRDIINFSSGNYNIQEGNIVHSWNFGHPRVTFSPNTYSTSGDCIYDKCWQAYCRDMYNVDNRRVTAYVILKGKPGVDVLRKWYYFDGCYWRLNAVSDWNLAGYEPVKCEFIKVIDTANYALDKIEDQGNESITLNPASIPCSGGVVEATIYLQSAGHWYMADTISGEDIFGNRYSLSSADIASQTTGSGEISVITLTFPRAEGAVGRIMWDISIEDDGDNWMHSTLEQEACGPSISISTSPTIDATATTISYSVSTNDTGGCVVRLSSAAIPQDLTNTHPSGTSNGSFTIPANTAPALVYWGLYATTADGTNSDYASIEQAGAGGAYVTGISFSNFEWTTDVPASGGTASSANCSFSVVANLSDGTSTDITNSCDFSSSTTLVVPATTATTRQSVGVINVIAIYYDAGGNPFSTTQVPVVYQAAHSWSPTDVGTFRFFINDPAYGAASPGYSAEFEDTSGANSMQVWVDNSIVMGCGFEGEVDSTAASPVDVVGEHSFQFNASYSGTSQMVISFDAEGTITGGVILTAVLQKGTDQKTITLPKWGGSRVQALVDLSDWFSTSGYIDVTIDLGFEIASAPTNYEIYIQKAGASVITSTTFYVTYTIKQSGTTIKSDTALLANSTTSTTISLPQLASGEAVLTALEVVPRPRVTGSSNRSMTASTTAGNIISLGRTAFSEGGETMYKWVKTGADLQITNGCALRLTMS